jgi:hypothetical protein
MRVGLQAIGAVAASTALLSIGCGSSTKAGGTSKPRPTAAQYLAQHDAGRSVAESSQATRRIAEHLKSLDAKCRGSEVEVAGAVDFAASDLAKHGIHRSRATLIADFDHNIHGFPANFDCVGFVTAYLVLTEGKT